MTGDRPQPGDLIVRAHSPSAIGVFVLTLAGFEHPLRSFNTYIDTLTYATRVAEQSEVDVWTGESLLATLTRIERGPHQIA
jgi:hypothetical protein